ncbi:MAG: hypothetical protein K1X83_02840 [Oligoflexia bacterium]|nr:hypothetical protein [Oligoflexia bacterium]
MLADLFFSSTERERSFREFHARKRAGMFKPDGRGEPSLVSLVQNFEVLTKAAFAALAAGDYQLGAAVPHRIWVDKVRTIHHFNWLDTFLIYHLARTLAAATAGLLPECLYSYRSGKSVRDALLKLRDYLGSDSGLTYVLRRDVSQFGEQMDHQLLLSDLRCHTDSEQLINFFRQICRFSPAAEADGRGLPGGHYLQLVCENLYLLKLDLEVSKQCSGCYLRFGDDILFVSKALDQARRARALIDAGLIERRLSCNAAKVKDLVIQDPSRHSAIAIDDFTPASRFVYLGSEVWWSGALAAPAQKLARLRRIISARILAATQAVADLPLTDRLQVAIQSVRNLLRESDLLAEGQSISNFLLHEQCNEFQLRELDRWLELLVIKSAHRRGFKKGHFSKFPPRLLRQLGLPSLLHLRRTHGC